MDMKTVRVGSPGKRLEQTWNVGNCPYPDADYRTAGISSLSYKLQNSVLKYLTYIIIRK